MLDIQCQRQDWQIDSGQILIDKRGQQGLNIAALVAALEMQKDFDFWFKLSGGVGFVILFSAEISEGYRLTSPCRITGQRYLCECASSFTSRIEY